MVVPNAYSFFYKSISAIVFFLWPFFLFFKVRLFRDIFIRVNEDIKKCGKCLQHILWAVTFFYFLTKYNIWYLKIFLLKSWICLQHQIWLLMSTGVLICNRTKRANQIKHVINYNFFIFWRNLRFHSSKFWS